MVFRNYGNADVDRDLLAGYLSVFSGLMKENSQSEIRSTTTNEFKYFYSNIDKFIIVVCSDLEDDDAIVNSKISTIRAKFIKRYGEILESGTWIGNRVIFNEFLREVDDIILGAIKVAIIGIGGSGKSELLQLICGKDIDLEYIPTINVDITSFDGETLGVHRSIVFWDLAGQANLGSLWKSLIESTDVVLLVLDSSFENVIQSKEILRNILEKGFNDVLIIGIANKQELPHRLTPEYCERILADVCDPPIKVFGMITSNPVYREKIHSILRNAIKGVLKGLKPSYKLRKAPIMK
jgi:small GTP-binding protein